jgi:NADH:ubiquinone oxidoreductase subunit E
MSDETAFLEKATTPAGNNPLEEKAASAGEVSTVDPLTISNIVEKHGTGRGGLISILQDIQIRYGYLPADALRIVATRTERSLVDIYGVATFYRCLPCPRSTKGGCRTAGAAKNKAG